MSNPILHLAPKGVFKYFYEISQIPRGSGNEKAISDYLVGFAKEHNLNVVQDEYFNILITKPGTKGYETAPTIILQGHMDMVCEKNQSTNHDFTCDPLQLRIIDDYIYANNTTLGADNGIAMAIGLALLASKDIPHPPLEILLTVEEETGLTGALKFDATMLKGKYLINLDSEDDTQLLTSCAGGIRTKLIISPSYKEITKDLIPYKISIRGLKGGHSGMDIDKGKGNANKILGRVLFALKQEMKLYIQDISGGAKDNAIPREADAIILINNSEIENMELIIKKHKRYLKKELMFTDPDIEISHELIESNFEKMYDENISNKIIQALMLIPNGIFSMSSKIEGLVESSSNLGVVKVTDEGILFDSAVRSSVNSLKHYIVDSSKNVAEVLNVDFKTISEYPGWEYNANSKLRELFIEVYNRLFDSKQEVVAIHAGVECGLFKEKRPDLDMVSLGPNMHDVHTPNEHVSISSVQKVWKYLLEVLTQVNSL